MPGGGLPNQGPQYIFIPFVSHGWAVGVLFILHILLVAFIMGTAWILVYTGSRPNTPKYARHERFTKTMALWLEVSYSMGATLAVFGTVVILGLFPRYFSVLVSTLTVPIAVAFAAWLVQILTLLLYYYLFDKVRPHHRALHQSLIVFYSIAETTFIVMITLFTSYQITPPATPTLTAAVSNPTWFPEALHRVAGNFSYSGYLIALWAAWRFFRKRRTGTSVDKAYYHWVGHLGFLWGIGWELAQLPIGTYYVLAIQKAGPQTYSKMMLTAGTSAEWLLQILLVSILFVLGDIYMWASIRAAVAEGRGRRALYDVRQLAPVGPRVPLTAQQEEPAVQAMQTAELGGMLPAGVEPPRRLERFAERWTRWGIYVLAADLVLAVLPDGIPVIGSMNAKWFALGVFLVWSLVSLVLYLMLSRRWTWGNMTGMARGALMLAGVTVALLMVTMGTIRYTNPQTSYIEHQMPLPPVRVQQSLAPQP